MIILVEDVIIFLYVNENELVERRKLMMYERSGDIFGVVFLSRIERMRFVCSW